MSYPITTARKILYDEITAMDIEVFDAIAPDNQEPPFAVFDTFSMGEASKCGYDVICSFSLYDLFNKQGGNIRIDALGEKLLRICEAVGTDVSINTSGVRTFNRANFRQQFTVTIKDIQ